MRVDYYEILDVPPTASAAEIKAAYRTQAMKFHPDHNPDSAAAEERFKLVSEAYRVLGVKERREDYDAWLERHHRFRNAPELADMVSSKPIHMTGEMGAMPHRTRVSARHAYERREERQSRRGRRGAPARSIPRPFLLRRTSRPSPLHMVLVYAFALFLIVPVLVKSCNAGTQSARRAQTYREPGESPLDEATQKANLERFAEESLQGALQGKAEAQYRYACILYHGYNGLEQDREKARYWLRKAKEQGHIPATRMLECLEAQEAAVPSAAE